MARRKGKRSYRRTKTMPLAASMGAAIDVVHTWDSIKEAPDMKAKARAIVRSHTGVDIEGEVPTDFSKIGTGAKALYGGMIISALAPKIPIVRTIPKRIPLIGKYLRW